MFAPVPQNSHSKFENWAFANFSAKVFDYIIVNDNETTTSSLYCSQFSSGSLTKSGILGHEWGGGQKVAQNRKRSMDGLDVLYM